MRSRSRKVDAAFWTLGLINNFTFVLFISAAEDLLTGYAGVILLCTVVPGFLSKLTFSFFADRLPYFGRIIAVSVSSCLCSLVVAYSSSIYVKLLAIVIQSAIGSLGEITFLALTSKHAESVVGAWSSGTGAAGIAGAGLYVLFKDVLHFSSKKTLITCSSIPLLMIAIYRSFLWKPVGFEPLPPNEAGMETSEIDTEREQHGGITRKQYFGTLLITYMLPLTAVYFGEYTINHGVLGTLTKFRDGRKHDVSDIYTQLQFVYQVGVFISRSSISIIRIQALWVPAMLQLLNLFVLTFSSMYVLLPSFPVAVLLILWEGLLGGVTYVNAFFRLRAEAPIHLKEWALGTATVADASGISMAAVVSIWLEQAILNFRGAAQGVHAT